MPGGMLSLSANGGTAGTGILWATLSRAGDANHTPQPGILRAYDASNVTRELWNSQQNAARDALGNFSKFTPPTVANGKVYVASLSNKLVVYGLIGAVGGNTAPVVDAGADQTIRRHVAGSDHADRHGHRRWQSRVRPGSSRRRGASRAGPARSRSVRRMR